MPAHSLSSTARGRFRLIHDVSAVTAYKQYRYAVSSQRVRYCNKTSKPFKTGKRLSAKSVACLNISSRFGRFQSLTVLDDSLALCSEQIPNELSLILR